jgi:hypothetical protein
MNSEHMQFHTVTGIGCILVVLYFFMTDVGTPPIFDNNV